VRIPAAFCHLFGFKPSLAHIGNLHGRNNPLGISVMGPLARTVQDAAAMVDVMSGRPDGGSEDISCLAASRREPGKLRVNMLLSSPIGDIDPRIVDATRSFAKTLESLGHTVREIAPVEGTLEEFMPVYRHCVATVPSISEKVLQPVTRWMRRDGRRTTKQEAQAAQASLVDRIQPILEDADVLLSPTVCMGAPKVGAFDAPDDPAAWFASASQVGALTVAFNLTNGPAVSLPMGLLDDGLPFGIQLGARVGADHLLWSLSRQVEDALPWHERHPPAFWPAS
jgi:amidase